MKKFESTMCQCCNQTVDYELPLSKGLALMLIKIYNFGKAKGINVVHLRKEMEGKQLTSNEVVNASHLIFHDLLEDLQEAGNVAITQKGFDFLGGVEIPRSVIVKKGSHEIIGYYQQERTTSLRKLLKEINFWEGGYIKTGEVIKK